MKTRELRTLDDLEEEYFRKHPEEIDEYLTLLFEEYVKDGNTGALWSFLHVLTRVQGDNK